MQTLRITEFFLLINSQNCTSGKTTLARLCTYTPVIVVRTRLFRMLFVHYSEFEDALAECFPISQPKSSQLFCQILVGPRWGACLSPSLSMIHPLFFWGS